MRPINRDSVYVVFFVLVLFSSGACKKLIEVPAPVTSTNGANVYQEDATAAAVLTGIYTNMSQTMLANGTSINSFMSLYPGLSADELALDINVSNASMISYYQNSLINTTGPNVWESIYPVIYICNSAITGLTASGTLTPAVKQQLMGEALFMRAFCYFYLVNLYAGVPLALSTNYKTDGLLSRSSPDSVYQQIITDLTHAQQLLNSQFLSGDALTPTSERVRPTKWAADALLSRVYLYQGMYAQAETEADSVISNSGLFSLTGLDTVFLANSMEAIWQLQPVNLGWNTEDARFFIIPPTGLNINNPVYLSASLLNAFEPGDWRRMEWVDSLINSQGTYYYPYKYKSDSLGAPVTEYEMVLRLGEQYLIRAEARANQGNITGPTGALSDLNAIRNRANLPSYAGATDEQSVITAILHERQVEFFTEWGQRWLDLKRANLVNSVMGQDAAAKAATWSQNAQYYPVPLSDLQTDPNLTQNNGY